MSQIFNSHLQLTFALNVILSNMLSSSRTCRRHNLLVLALVSRPSGLHLKRCGFKYIGKLRQQLCAVRTDTHCYSYTRRLYCKKHAVTDTFLLTSIPLDSNDESLFRSIRYNPQHVLHQLLPPPKFTGYNLRSRGHSLTLSVIPSEFIRKNFIKLTACCSMMIYIDY